MDDYHGRSIVSCFDIRKPCLGSISRPTIAQSVNQAYRKGIRRGLCMRNRLSVRDRLGEWFVELSGRKGEEVKNSIHKEGTSLSEQFSQGYLMASVQEEPK